MTDKIFYPSDPPGTLPSLPNPAVPGQGVTIQLPTPSVQPPQTLPTAFRQYPNLNREWFSSDAAHAGVRLAFRNLFDMTYDAQDAIKMIMTSNPGIQLKRQPIISSGAVNPSQRANYLIASVGIAAMTLGAPRKGIDDGTVLDLTSSTAYQHTLTTPGLLLTGTASVNTATWPTKAGGSLILEAQSGLWLVKNFNQISFS